MPFFHCELTGGLSRLSFSTADDPFYKTSESKYYPECIVYNSKGQQLARVNPDNRKTADIPMTYVDDIRDTTLKINDDRRVQINFNQMKEPGTFILLTVKEYPSKDGKPIGKEGEFDRAWFRLSNDETNQTIDYSVIKKIDMPEDYTEFVAPDDEDEDALPF